MKGGPTMLPMLPPSVVPRAKIRVRGLQGPLGCKLGSVVLLLNGGWRGGGMEDGGWVKREGVRTIKEVVSCYTDSLDAGTVGWNTFGADLEAAATGEC